MKNEKQINQMMGILVSHQSEFSGLTTEEIQWIIQNPKDAVALYIRAIKMRKHKSFPVWKTIKIGTGLVDAEQFCTSIKNIGGKISNYVNNIMKKPEFTVASKETEFDLVNVSGSELGFEENATRKDIYKRAFSLGLELCPAEAGPQLRLQYKDQPKGEWLLVGMEPIKDSDGVLHVFFVYHVVDDFWLGTYCGRPDGVWGPGCRWVFVRPRRK